MKETWKDTHSRDLDNPMDHPEEQPITTEAPFRLGRLLLVLASAVLLIGIIAIAASAYLAP
ncbi:MAG: hypothetical protein ACO1NO_10760 [Burkholderiaceae bacterium]